MTDRGQTCTLEAFVASILLLSTVAFALQTVAISSNTASAADTRLRSQQAGLAEGVVDQSAANGTLRTTLLYWNETEERFYDAHPQDGYYIARGPPTRFGDGLAGMFVSQHVKYNVDLYYPTASGSRGHQRLVESGTPADNAVRVVETVTLYDDTRLVDANESARNVTLADVEADANSTFYAPDAEPGGPIYSVIRVEVVLWEN